MTSCVQQNGHQSVGQMELRTATLASLMLLSARAHPWKYRTKVDVTNCIDLQRMLKFLQTPFFLGDFNEV